MKKEFLILAFSFLFSGMIYSQTTKTFATKVYSIDYPAAWRLDTTKTLAPAVLFFSPPDSAKDSFDENVNIMEQNLAGKHIDLSAYKTISEDQMSKMGPEAKVLRSAIEKSPGGEIYSFECLMTMNGNKLRVKSICKIRNDVAYLVSFTTRTESFEQYSTVGNQILDSFKFN